MIFTNWAERGTINTSTCKGLPNSCAIIHTQPKKANNSWKSIKLPNPSTLEIILHFILSLDTKVGRIGRKISSFVCFHIKTSSPTPYPRTGIARIFSLMHGGKTKDILSHFQSLVSRRSAMVSYISSLVKGP